MAHLSKYSYSILYASAKACALPRTVWIRRISTSSTHRSISEQAEGERMLSLCFAVPNEDTNLTAVDLSSSIHAPLAGCDARLWAQWLARSAFQSTHPLRGATRQVCATSHKMMDFNPRTPCGVRPQIRNSFISSAVFQSTHPLRGATPPGRTARALWITFQSTHPLRGATDAEVMEYMIRLDFNPRTPCGVRLGQVVTIKNAR